MKLYACRSTPSLPGLTRQSIDLRKKFSRRRWMRGSSPRMTGSRQFSHMCAKQRVAQPRRGGQLSKLRIDVRSGGCLIGVFPAAVGELHELDVVPVRDVGPADHASLAISENGLVRRLNGRLLRLSLAHRLDDVIEPRPSLRGDARAALIRVAAAALPAPAGFVVAQAP